MFLVIDCASNKRGHLCANIAPACIDNRKKNPLAPTRGLPNDQVSTTHSQVIFYHLEHALTRRSCFCTLFFIVENGIHSTRKRPRFRRSRRVQYASTTSRRDGLPRAGKRVGNLPHAYHARRPQQLLCGLIGRQRVLGGHRGGKRISVGNRLQHEVGLLHDPQRVHFGMPKIRASRTGFAVLRPRLPRSPSETRAKTLDTLKPAVGDETLPQPT